MGTMEVGQVVGLTVLFLAGIGIVVGAIIFSRKMMEDAERKREEAEDAAEEKMKSREK